MRRIGFLGLGLLLFATAAPAAERKGSGTLARLAVPARPGRLAEIAKDATPPKPGGPKLRVREPRVTATSGRRTTTR